MFHEMTNQISQKLGRHLWNIKEVIMNASTRQRAIKLSLLCTIIFVAALGLFSGGAAAQATYELEPVALCVRDLGVNANPRYEAHFAYRNNTLSVFDVPAGITGNGINELTGGFADPFLPTSFVPGQSDNWPGSAFYVAFNDGAVTWTLGTTNDLNNGAASAFVTPDSQTCAYQIVVDKVWIDANGEGTFIPPMDLTPEWRLDMMAFDSNGVATGAFGNCIYLLPDPTLRCLYSNPGSNIIDRLIVPEGGSYEVLETPDLAPEWVPADPSGLGQFNPVTVYCETPYGGNAADCYHLVRNQAGLEAGIGTLVINKFNDLDGDGVQDAGELALDGFTFNVVGSEGSVAGSPFSTSGGTVSATLPVGTYTVSENTPDNCWIQTTGPSGEVTVAINSTTTVVFGNHNVCTPTETPTETPTSTPTETPTEVPTETPTEVPTETPTEVPTETPTEVPTETPTEVPTETPTEVPTETPTSTPTETPTEVPTETPTEVPTETPTEPPLGCQGNNPDRLDCSSLEVSGTCDGTTAVFTITNTGEPGNGDMRAPTQYRIIVDGVVVETGTVQIAGGATMTVSYSGGGNITLEADQQIGHPGGSQPQATVSCG
jgi:hypothetical protein